MQLWLSVRYTRTAEYANGSKTQRWTTTLKREALTRTARCGESCHVARVRELHTTGNGVAEREGSRGTSTATRGSSPPEARPPATSMHDVAPEPESPRAPPKDSFSVGVRPRSKNAQLRICLKRYVCCSKTFESLNKSESPETRQASRIASATFGGNTLSTVSEGTQSARSFSYLLSPSARDLGCPAHRERDAHKGWIK